MYILSPGKGGFFQDFGRLYNIDRCGIVLKASFNPSKLKQKFIGGKLKTSVTLYLIFKQTPIYVRFLFYLYISAWMINKGRSFKYYEKQSHPIIKDLHAWIELIIAEEIFSVLNLNESLHWLKILKNKTWIAWHGVCFHLLTLKTTQATLW